MEQISLVPKTTEKIADVIQRSPHERTHETVVEYIGSVPVPQIKEDGLQLEPQEREQNRTRTIFVDVPVLHIKEKIVDRARVLPQERVQNRVTYTGKVFTVEMRHHRGDQACAVDICGLHQGSPQAQHA